MKFVGLRREAKGVIIPVWRAGRIRLGSVVVTVCQIVGVSLRVLK